MDPGDFEAAVAQALKELPTWVRERIENLSVVVAEWPTAEQRKAGPGLLGLYEGVSLHDRGNDYFGVMPDVITIFRQPHLRLGLDPEELWAEIRRTVLHEIAHHIGLDDTRLQELGWG